MQLRTLACLPGVWAPPDAIDLGGSRVTRLTFEEWLALEGQSQSAVYNKLETNYTRNPPAFWEWSLEIDPQFAIRDTANTSELSKLARRDLDLLVAAIHWYTGFAPIHPRHSVTYFDTARTEQGVPRVYGESDKEYATENSEPTIVLRACDAGPLAAMVSFARETAANWKDGAYQHAVQSMALTSTPGLGWPTRVLLLVGAFEALLLPDVRKGLQQAFGDRFAALVTDDPAERREWVSRSRLGYMLRSDLVHARSLDATVAQLQTPPAEFVARLERAGVVALCRLLGGSALLHQWQVEPTGAC
jgi:hypothetical protein